MLDEHGNCLTVSGGREGEGGRDERGNPTSLGAILECELVRC